MSEAGLWIVTISLVVLLITQVMQFLIGRDERDKRLRDEVELKLRRSGEWPK